MASLRILSPAEAQHLATLRQDGVVVLVTGVFDLLHKEHQAFLLRARAAGDVLVVGIESDQRVRQLKGEDRPIWPQEHRKNQLELLQSVSMVVILPDDFHNPEQRTQLLLEVRPDVLAVSSHTPHLEQKRAAIQAIGGKLQVVHQHNPSISTTKLVASACD